MSELTELAATQLGRLVAQGEVTATEVVEAHLRRANEVNPMLNAITDLQAESALEQAAQSDKDLDQMRFLGGRITGVPITIKSSIAVKGFRHECGTQLRLGEVAQADAPLVADLKSVGAIVIGTTNVPEFLMAYETDNAIYGRTNSPLNQDFTPGGSSGGCSAARQRWRGRSRRAVSEAMPAVPCAYRHTFAGSTDSSRHLGLFPEPATGRQLPDLP